MAVEVNDDYEKDESGRNRVEANKDLNLEMYCHSSGVTEVNHEGYHIYLSYEN
jgi:hypothetical protein